MIRTTGIPSSGLERGDVLVSLSPREAEVAGMVMGGMGAAEISQELGLAESSVRGYIYRLCQGLQLRGVQELLLWALQNPDAVLADPALRRPGRCGLHPRSCGCGSPYCAMRMRLKKAA